jgi:hypothetical protein|tara:strand:+ start:892 stop:1212 length:321 start_codon:yes stop_codon:yes gene_type:complete
MYKLRGEITNIENETINTQKGDYVKKLITIEESDTGFSHVQQFEIFGKEKIDLIETKRQLSIGQFVNINFYIKSREYKGKFYNTLMIKDLIIEDSAKILSDDVPFS